MKQKHLSTIIALGVALIFLLLGCATWQNLIGQPHYKTFELTIDKQKVVVNLPKELPSMEKALLNFEQCFNAGICRQQFCVSEDIGHDHVDFVFAGIDIKALVWLKNQEMEFEKKFIAWVYVEKKPISVAISRIQDLIKEHRPK